MPSTTTTRRSGVPSRVRSAKNRCRRVISLMPATGINEDGVTRALAELEKASDELRTELQAMQVQRARAAKRRVPRSGLKDARGRKRAPVTLPGYNTGREPGNKGKKYPPSPPTVSEILRMLALAPTMRLVQTARCPDCHRGWRQPHAHDCINPYGERMRAWMYLTWNGGLRNGCEALRLQTRDLFPTDGYLYVAKGKNGESREVAIDPWVWPAIDPWLRFRDQLPDGPLFCVLEGPTAGVRAWADTDVRKHLKALADQAGIRHRVAPHQLRHARAVEDWEAGIDPLIIGRNLGHKSLQVTDAYFKGIGLRRIREALRKRPVPTVPLMDVLRGDGATLVHNGDRPRDRPAMPAPDLMTALGGSRHGR